MAKNKTATVEAPEVAYKSLGFIDVSPNDCVQEEGVRLTGRYDAPPEDKVIAMAISMSEEGQLSPIQVVKHSTEAGKFVPVFGRTRAEAARMIVNGFQSGNAEKPKQHKPNPSFQLKAEVVEIDPRQARRRNAIENFIRAELSSMDIAANVHDLMEDGFQPKEICEMTGLERSALTRYAQIGGNILPNDVKDAIHDGTIAFMTGVTLAKPANSISQEEASALLAKHGENLTITAVEEYIRERAANAKSGEETAASEETPNPDGEVLAEGGKKKATVGRTKKVVVDMLKAYVEDTSDEMKSTGGRMLKVIFAAVVNYANDGGVNGKGESVSFSGEDFNKTIAKQLKVVNKLATPA